MPGYFYVYVLFSVKDHRLYIGWTPDLVSRIKKHNLGYVQATRPRRPLILIYHEVFTNKLDSLQREKFFKSGWGRIHLKKTLRETLTILTDENAKVIHPINNTKEDLQG